MMTPEDKAAHADWVYAVNKGQTTLGLMTGGSSNSQRRRTP